MNVYAYEKITDSAPMPALSRFFLVDVEASSLSPMSGKMTEFGVVNASTLNGFYAHLWPFTPHPDAPALPVVAEDASPENFVITYSTDGYSERKDFENASQVAEALMEWLNSENSNGATMVSDNPAFDAMWMTCWFDSLGFSSPFGFSARRIGDLYAGLTGKWKNANSWKRLRKVAHTHNPFEDSLGNANALRTILTTSGQL